LPVAVNDDADNDCLSRARITSSFRFPIDTVSKGIHAFRGAMRKEQLIGIGMHKRGKLLTHILDPLVKNGSEESIAI